jgi:hypothetical protein
MNSSELNYLFDCVHVDCSKISLFHNADQVFIRALSRCIRPIFFLRGEYIVRKYDIGTKMFFIYRGSVEVVSDDEIVYDTMSVGEAFGELALLFNITRTASVRARVNTDLFMLSKSDINSLMERYPQIQPQIFKIANERMRMVRSRNVAQNLQQGTKPQPVDDAEFLPPQSSFSMVSRSWRPAESPTSASAFDSSSPSALESDKPAIPARVDRPDVLTNTEIDGNYELPRAVLNSQLSNYLEAVLPRDLKASVDNRLLENHETVLAAKGTEIIEEGTSFTLADANGEYVFFNLCLLVFEELLCSSLKTIPA